MRESQRDTTNRQSQQDHSPRQSYQPQRHPLAFLLVPLNGDPQGSHRVSACKDALLQCSRVVVCPKAQQIVLPQRIDVEVVVSVQLKLVKSKAYREIQYYSTHEGVSGASRQLEDTDTIQQEKPDGRNKNRNKKRNCNYTSGSDV